VKRSAIPFFLSSSAADDLNRETLYLLETAGEAISLRFLRAAEDTISLIADFPRLGTLCSSLASPASTLRWKPLTGRFARWLVFYRITPDRVEIVRILRGERTLQQLL
jgi:plasmid stabilization system protein ParE